MRKIETNTINMSTVNSQLHKIKIASGEQVTAFYEYIPEIKRLRTYNFAALLYCCEIWPLS
jgi:hypothetical protein